MSRGRSGRDDRSGVIRIGIGGWSYPPWRGTLYPGGLAQRRELAYAARHLTSIEINATFYRTQTAASFVRWHDETPDDFVFAVKAPRYATTRPVLADAGESIARFLDSGILKLKDKLGPINWQFMPTRTFDADDVAAFLDLLPKKIDSRPLRHALEVRHVSFRCPAFVDMARAHGVAIVVAADGRYPQIADLTAPFVYVRLMGTREAEPLGYEPGALGLWAARAQAWSTGGIPEDLNSAAVEPAPATARDVFLYVIGGNKERNPIAAMALIERLALKRS